MQYAMPKVELLEEPTAFEKKREISTRAFLRKYMKLKRKNQGKDGRYLRHEEEQEEVVAIAEGDELQQLDVL